MSSTLRLVTSSNVISNAEKMVLAENQRLTSEEKKRRLLTFGPMGQDVVGTTNNIPNNLPPPVDLTIEPQSGDIYLSSSTNVPGSAEIRGLGCLSPTGHLFIRHAGQNFTQKFFDLANKYEILNSDGLLVLFAGETLERFGTEKRDRTSILFDVTVLGLDGSAVLNIMSRRGASTVSDFQKVIGTCIDVSSVFAPHETYSIRDWNMCELFRLKKSSNGPPGEFDIISNDSNKVGQFTNNWSTSIPNYVAIDKVYGVSFPVDMANEEKAILFGSLFGLYFQHLHDGGIRDNHGKFWAYGISIFIGVLLFIGVLTIILWGVLRE